ncbi:MAG: hypothetical protein ACYC7I_11505, partial [Gammaproteobacteria bacterium]
CAASVAVKNRYKGQDTRDKCKMLQFSYNQVADKYKIQETGYATTHGNHKRNVPISPCVLPLVSCI